MAGIHKSLNERARALGIATDLPGINRSDRRRDLKTAIKEEKMKQKKIVKSLMVKVKRKFIGAKEA